MQLIGHIYFSCTRKKLEAEFRKKSEKLEADAREARTKFSELEAQCALVLARGDKFAEVLDATVMENVALQQEVHSLRTGLAESQAENAFLRTYVARLNVSEIALSKRRSVAKIGAMFSYL
jgi:regulator of replication initiation timing